MMTLHDDTKSTRWTGFAASIPGGGHIRHGIPCQDASAVMTSPRPAAIVCDGRGSAKLSHFGAQSAVDAFRFQVSVLEPFLVSILDGEEEKTEQWVNFCRIMYRTLMQVKYDLAEKHNEAEKEFDCTVAFAIAGEKHIGCFQVGDGSIVVRQNGICKTVFLPEKGEFANQTHFLRPGGEEQMKFQHALLDTEVNSGIAITSDGPEHLMFRLADMTPGKIFDMFLEDLRKEELCKQDLMDYLTRREWADDPRGSDDRSLALLARIGFEPAVVPVPAEAHELVSEDTSEVKSETTPESETAQEHSEDVKSEPAQESFAEMEVQTEVPAVSEESKKMEVQAEVPTVSEESKKKVIPSWTLAVVSGLALGFLAETVCLMMQRQTISRQQTEITEQAQTIYRQRAEILYLRQDLAFKKQEDQVLPKSTQPQPNQADESAAKEKEPEPTQPQSSLPDVLVAEAEKSGTASPSPVPPAATDRGERKPDILEKESSNSPDTSEKAESGNIHKEDIPHEM